MKRVFCYNKNNTSVRSVCSWDNLFIFGLAVLHRKEPKPVYIAPEIIVRGMNKVCSLACAECLLRMQRTTAVISGSAM